MDRLRMGVISCSGMAKGHMTAIEKNPRADLVAVCDIDLEKARKAAEEFNVTRVYQDYKELLAQPDIDGVVIVTPDQLHREMAEEALRAGKHVLCEKPLALTREECASIVHAAQASDKKFMVGQICRYTPGFMKAKELVERGEIGELTFVESEYAHDYTGLLETWRADPLRNGVVGGGCHAVDLLRWIAGDPTRITAYANHKSFLDKPYDDTTIAIMQFPNQVIGKVFVSISCKRNYTMRTVLYGTKGTIITDNTSNHMLVFKEALAPGESLLEGLKPINTPVQIPIKINNHNTVGEFNEFCDIVLNDKPVATTALEGAKTVAACSAIVESAKTLTTIVPDYNF